MQTIDPRALARLCTENPGLPLLDVRTPAEHSQVHVPGVHLIPLDKLKEDALAALPGVAKDRPLYVFCRSGGRATKAAGQMQNWGYENCVVVEGGTEGWAAAGLPVNRGQTSVISLERQVRIAAGSLVLLGIILGTWVAPGFYGISAFVGTGLIFAGVTDWCGMGLLLARMPWNQRSSCTQG